MIMHEGRLRYLITLWPLVALIIAAGIYQLRQQRLLIVAVLVAAFAIWFIGPWRR